MGRPTQLLVTGPAGAGKTTLAYAVGAALGAPVVSRDAIKEGMAAAEPGFVAAPDDPLTRRTFAVFFANLDLLLRSEVSTVAEAAFQHSVWRRGLGLLDDLADLRLVRCRVDAAVAQQRMRQRTTDQPTRAAHADADHLAAAAPFTPLVLDVPTLEVDTTDGYRPALASIVEFARGGPA